MHVDSDAVARVDSGFGGLSVVGEYSLQNGPFVFDLEINFPRTTALAKEKGSFARIKSGKVVRVERRSILKNASIGVAISFESGFDQE